MTFLNVAMGLMMMGMVLSTGSTMVVVFQNESSTSRLTENGWSTFDPSPDTIIYYVSSSDGNDTNDGLSNSTPFQTLAHGLDALRKDHPDWLLIKRGDVFEEGFGIFQKTGGRSAKEKMVISTYGDSTSRPLFKIPRDVYAMDIGSNYHMAICGVDLYPITRDPTSPEFISSTRSSVANHVLLLWGLNDFLFEDNRVRYTSITLQAGGADIELRRNILHNAYDGVSHAQSIFSSIDGNLLIEENILVHGGWNEDFIIELYEPNPNPNEWKTVQNGRFRLQISSSDFIELTGINFSNVNTMDDVAQVLEDNLNSILFTERGLVDEFSVVWIASSFLLQKKSLKSNSNFAVLRYIQGTIDITPVSSDSTVLKMIPEATNFSDWQVVSDSFFKFKFKRTFDTGYRDYVVTGTSFSHVSSMGDVAETFETAINSVLTDRGVNGSINAIWNSTSKELIFIGLNGSLSPFNTNPISHLTYYFAIDEKGTDLHTSQWLNGSKLANPSSDIFNRNMYLSSGYGRTIVKGNIDADGSQGGMQLRMGGIAENNLFLQNPISINIGHAQNPPDSVTSGIVRYNVVLGGRDLSDQNQGTGLTIHSHESSRYGHNSIQNLEVYRNIIAHNEYGSGNVNGISLSFVPGSGNIQIFENIVYDWNLQDHLNPDDDRGFAFKFGPIDGIFDLNISHNIFQQPRNGFVIGTGDGFLDNDGLTLSNNTYYSTSDVEPTRNNNGWFSSSGVAMTIEEFDLLVRQSGVTLNQVHFSDANRDISTYAASIGLNPSYESFIEAAKLQSRLNWDSRLTSCEVNDYIRRGFNISETGCLLPPADFSPPPSSPLSTFPSSNTMSPRSTNSISTNVIRTAISTTNVISSTTSATNAISNTISTTYAISSTISTIGAISSVSTTNVISGNSPDATTTYFLIWTLSAFIPFI